jgi:hypothetical protein
MEGVAVCISSHVFVDPFYIARPCGVSGAEEKFIRPRPPRVIARFVLGKTYPDVAKVVKLLYPVIGVQNTLSLQPAHVIPDMFRDVRKLISKRVRRKTLELRDCLVDVVVHLSQSI